MLQLQEKVQATLRFIRQHDDLEENAKLAHCIKVQELENELETVKEDVRKLKRFFEALETENGDGEIPAKRAKLSAETDGPQKVLLAEDEDVEAKGLIFFSSLYRYHYWLNVFFHASTV